MKKKIFGLFAMMMVALVSVSLVSCGDDDEGGSLNLSETQIREYLESGSGAWEMTELDEGESYTHTMYFIDGKTNGYMGSSTMVKYSVSGNKVYINKSDGTDVLEGGIVITYLTSTSLKGYWAGNQANTITGVKVNLK